MNAMYAILKENGVAAKDIQTTQIQVTPEYSQPPNRPRVANEVEFVPRIVGYRVDNTVQITRGRSPNSARCWMPWSRPEPIKSTGSRSGSTIPKSSWMKSGNGR